MSDEELEEESSDEDVADESDELCAACAGSGEGYSDGSVCSICKGKGVIREPEEYDDSDEYERIWEDRER